MNSKSTEILHFSTPSGDEISLPLATVTGDRPGPTGIITAGVHGCEYPGIVGAIRLFKTLDPSELRGSVKIVTVTSTAAFESRNMFVSPADNLNPNRVFPGNPHGSYSEVLADRIMNIVAEGDYYIDLHGGDMVEDLEPFSIFHKGAGEKLDRLSFEIAKYYGLPNIVSTQTDGVWPDNGTTYANASEKLKVPAAIVEVGGRGILDEQSVQMHLKGLLNVLRHFGNLNGRAEEPNEQELFTNMKWVFSKSAGIFYISINTGDNVEKGQVLGRIENFFGKEIEIITSPTSGKALFTTSSPAVKENGLLMGIGIK